MRHRVLVDTCVLVAASTYSVSEEIGVPIKHQFYDECAGLMAIFERELSKRIGVITVTVENEAFSVLGQVVRGELEKKVADRRRLFEALSFCLNACEDRMARLSAMLLREPVLETECQKHFVTVSRMYADMEDLARETLPPEQVAEALTMAAPRKFRRVVSQIYRDQEWAAREQLARLITKPVEESDKKILAEAMYLQSVYRETERGGMELLLASTDHHFSPVRWLGLESRPVTDEIKARCGITCDWPGRIAEYIKKGSSS